MTALSTARAGRIAAAGILCGAAACIFGSGAPAGAAVVSDGAVLSYSVTVQAPLLQITEDEPTSTFHPEGEGDLGYSFASLDPSGEHALSSWIWPGSAAGNAGTLLEVLGVASGQSELNDPVRAEATSGTSQTQQSTTAPTGTEMSATVQPPSPGDQYSSSKAAVAAADLGAPLSVAASTSSSTIRFDSASSLLKGEATSALHDVQLDGGLISIASVTSHATATSDNGATPVMTGSTVIQGLTIAGQSAYVDGSGVHLGTPSSPAGPAVQDAVNAALQSAGMQVYSTTPAKVTIGEIDYYDASSLLFYWAPPGDTSNNSFTASVGGAAVSMAADSSGVNLPGLDLGSSDTGLLAAGTGLAGATPSPVLSLPTDATPALSTQPPRPSPPPKPVVRQSGSLAAVSLPGGLGAGWWVLIVLGGLAGAWLLAGVPRAVATSGRDPGACPNDSHRTHRSNP